MASAVGRDVDVIVVGSGIIGLWTSYHLAKTNKKVLLIEQFKLQHELGSSHGRSRLMKKSHRKPHCADIVPEAIELWKELERITNSQLLYITGHLSVAQTSSTGQLMDDLIKVMRDRHISFDYLPGLNICEKFPNLNFDHSFEGYYEDKGGVLMANLCRKVLVDELSKMGVEIVDETKVVRLQSDGNRVQMTTTSANGDYDVTGKSAVLCCGSWINRLLHPKFQLDVKTVRVMTYYWKEKMTSSYSRDNNFPPLMIYCGNYHVYSVPSDDHPGYLKICYHVRHEIDPDSHRNYFDEEMKKEEEKRFKELKEIVRLHFPDIDVEQTPIQETCLQTVTPNSNFILTRHPTHDNVVIGAGFSGHGFGVAPSIGRILSDMVATRGADAYARRNFPVQIRKIDHDSKM